MAMINYKQAWAQGQGVTPLAARMVAISSGLMGGVYKANALIGGPDTPEEMVLYPEGLDCVTFVETALALALVHDYNDYPEALRQIRYQGGEINWAKRQHYFTQGLKALVEAGILVWPAGGQGVEKELNLVVGLPCVQAVYPQFDHQDAVVLQQLHSGDIVAFSSTRGGLDVFHCGIIAVVGDKVLLRHYSSKAGHALEEPLVDFLGRSTMVGLVVAQPTGE